METPWVRFCCLLLCLASYSSIFVILFFRIAMFIFFVSRRLCSSHLLLSASTYSLVDVLSGCCVISTLPHLGIELIFVRLVVFTVALISRVAFFCCALVRLVFLCITVCDYRYCTSLGWRIGKDTRVTADIAGKKERFNVKITTTADHLGGSNRSWHHRIYA